MIHDIEQDHRSVGQCVEAPVKGCEVEAVEIRSTAPLAEIGRDEPLAHNLSPLRVVPESSDAGLETLPYYLGRLMATGREFLPRIVGGTNILVG